MSRIPPLLVASCAMACWLSACGSAAKADAGSDAGPVYANCRQIGQVTGPVLNVFQDGDMTTGNPFINQVYLGVSSEVDAGTFDLLVVEYYWGSAAAVATPHRHTISSAETYDSCSECVTLRTQCAVSVSDAGVPSLGCGKRFFGQSGDLLYTTFGTSSAGGSMVGSGSNLRLVEWVYSRSGGSTGADFAFPGGDCVDLAGYSYNLTYVSNGAGGYSWDAGN